MSPFYGGYMGEKNMGIAFSSGGSGKGNKIQLVAGKTSKNVSQKRLDCQKGKGKGRGKGGIIGKGGWSVSKAVHACDHLMKTGSVEELQDTDVGVIDEDSRSSFPDDDKLDVPEEKCFPTILSIKVGECNSESSASDNILCDQKLRAMTKVRLGRLEDDVSLAKPAADVSQTVLGVERGSKEPEQDPVFTRPQTARRRKRKRTDSSSSAEPRSVSAEKERQDQEVIETFHLKFVSDETVGQGLPSATDCSVHCSVGEIALKNICGNDDTKKNKNRQETDSLEKTVKPKVIKVKFKDRSYVQKVFKKKKASVSVVTVSEKSGELSQNHGHHKQITNEVAKNCQKKFKDSGDKVGDYL